MVAFQGILEQLQASEDRLQSPEVNQYLTTLNKLLSAYQDLNLMGCINTSVTPAEAMMKLNETIASDRFQRYVTYLSELAINQEGINVWLSRYNEKAKNLIRQEPKIARGYVSLEAYSLRPVQHLPRLKMLLSEVQKKFEEELELKTDDTSLLAAIQSVKQSISRTEELPRAFNEKVTARDQLKSECVKVATQIMSSKNASQRKVSLLKAILELHLNNPLEAKSIQVTFFDTYLKHLLVQAYPKDFAFQGAMFVIHQQGSLAKNKMHYQLMLEALGVSNIENMTFNPAFFNAERLDQLFQDSKNPLWLVLKSTIPVSTRFSASQKIAAYIELAKAFYDKKIGAKEKYLGAFSMARAACSVNTTDPQAQALREHAFAPVDSTKTPRQLAKKKRFGNWIVAKHQEHAKPGENKQMIRANILAQLPSQTLDRGSIEKPSFFKARSARRVEPSEEIDTSDSQSKPRDF